MNTPVALLKDYLISNNLKISVAESLTSGLIQNCFASVSGISACFEGGVTAYSLGQKVSLLKVDESHAQSVNCVSERVAIEMAKGVSLLFETEISISSTGYAEPCPEENVVDPHAYVSVYIQGSVYTQQVKYSEFFPNSDPNHDQHCRESMRSAATATAISLLLQKLDIESPVSQTAH